MKGAQSILKGEPSNYDTEDTLTLDLRDLLRILRKWRKMIVLLTVVAMVTSGVFTMFFIPPVYEAKAILLVTQPSQPEQKVKQQGEGLESVVGAVSSLPQMTVNTYVGQVKAGTVMERVIKKLKLDPVAYTPASLGGMVQVSQPKDTNLIEIKVTNTDPKLAADIANAVSEEFLNFISDNNQAQMAKSLEFLEGQRKSVQKDLAAAADALKDFNSKPRGVELLQEQVKKRMADLTEYQTQLNQAQIEISQLEAARDSLAAQLKNTPQTIEVKQPVSTTDSSGDTSTIVALEEVNPVYVSLQQSLAEKKAAIAEKEAQMDGLQSIIAQVQGGLEGLQAELTSKSTARSALTRQVEQLEKAEGLLSEKTTETKVARSINLGEANLLLVAPALPPTGPIKPNKKLIVAVAAVVGCAVAIGLALLLEYLDNTIREPEDLERQLGLPVLGTIPEAGNRRG